MTKTWLLALGSLVLGASVASAAPVPGSLEAVVGHAFYDLGFIKFNKRDLAHSGARDQTPKFAIASADCSRAIADALDAGESPGHVVHLDGFAAASLDVKLGEADATVCGELAAVGATFDADVAAARNTDNAKLGAPFQAAGIGGDKLAFLIAYVDSSDLFGIGGQLLSTPASIKHASVLFRLSSSARDGWTLHRMSFQGNKQISHTQQGFLVRPGPAAFR